ncbi:MAG: LLM class flavin-dependent oxidoreductase [Acidimicrobiales bacterium]
MDLGLALPQYDFSVPGEDPLRWDTVVGTARRAEDLGFASVWLSDHLFLDLEKYGGAPRQYACLDPLVALAALARATRTVRLGTLTLCPPLRPATVLAKALATLDVVSGGRLTVGIGAGWYRPEMEGAGVAYERPAARLAQLAEAVQVLRGMFGGGPCSFTGVYESAVGARCLPRPLQRPHPPIWIGGKGDRLLDIVAKHADGWNTAWAWTPEAYEERLGVLRRACERIGRDPASVTLSVGLYALVGDDEADLARRFERLRSLSLPGLVPGLVPGLADWRRGKLVGTVEQVGEQCGRWRDLGVSSLIVNAGAVPFALASPDDLELIATACRL